MYKFKIFDFPDIGNRFPDIEKSIIDVILRIDLLIHINKRCLKCQL